MVALSLLHLHTIWNVLRSFESPFQCGVGRSRVYKQIGFNEVSEVHMAQDTNAT